MSQKEKAVTDGDNHRTQQNSNFRSLEAILMRDFIQATVEAVTGNKLS